MSQWQDGSASAATRTVKSGAGRVYTLVGRNTGAGVAYLFFYALAAKPSNGSVAHVFVPLKLDPGATFSMQLDRPRDFAQGFCWAASSTDGSLTYASGATLNVAAEYD